MGVWCAVCAALAAAAGYLWGALMTRRRDADCLKEAADDVAVLQGQNRALRRRCRDLRWQMDGVRNELEDERYRHDRVQDFCVEQGKLLDAAKRDLRDCSACFTCKRNGVSCHPGTLVAPPDVLCGSYRWRGERSKEIATPVCGLVRNDSCPLEVPEVADG